MMKEDLNRNWLIIEAVNRCETGIPCNKEEKIRVSGIMPPEVLIRSY